MANKNIEPLMGIIQMDETFIGGLNKNRHENKKIKGSQGRSLKDKITVFGMIDLKGNVITKVVENTQGATLKPIIKENVVAEKSIIISDEWWGYNDMDEEFKHIVINHFEKEYVRGAFHTNTIKGFWI